MVFADWIFFGATVSSPFVFRLTHALAGRPPDAFTTPGYPLLPALFVLMAAGVVFSVVRADPVRAALGAALLAAGVPVFYACRSSRPALRTE